MAPTAYGLIAAAGALCEPHRCRNNRGYANLGLGDRIVEEKTAHDEVAVFSHQASTSNRIHSWECGDEFNRMRGAPLHFSRKLRKHFGKLRRQTGRSQTVAPLDLVPSCEAPLAETALGTLLLSE